MSVEYSVMLCLQVRKTPQEVATIHLYQFLNDVKNVKECSAAHVVLGKWKKQTLPQGKKGGPFNRRSRSQACKCMLKTPGKAQDRTALQIKINANKREKPEVANEETTGDSCRKQSG